MISKQELSFVRSLQQKKFRNESGCFVAEGTKIVPELLAGHFTVKKLYATPAWLGRNPALTANIASAAVNETELERISGLTTPNEVLAVFETPAYPLQPEKLLTNRVLVLDDIRDPGNLGTMIRIADWFGIAALVCSPETTEVWNPKVVQASMGSVARIPVHYTPLPEFIASMKALDPGIAVMGTFLGGESLYTHAMPDAGLLVIGNESNGISDAVGKMCNVRLTIPSFSAAAGKTGTAESLNAAIAAALALSEWRR